MFPKKSEIIQERARRLAEAVTAFREEITKELQKHSGGILSITIPSGLTKEALDEIIIDLDECGWEASVYEAPRGEGSMLNIK